MRTICFPRQLAVVFATDVQRFGCRLAVGDVTRNHLDCRLTAVKEWCRTHFDIDVATITAHVDLLCGTGRQAACQHLLYPVFGLLGEVRMQDRRQWQADQLIAVARAHLHQAGTVHEHQYAVLQNVQRIR